MIRDRARQDVCNLIECQSVTNQYIGNKENKIKHFVRSTKCARVHGNIGNILRDLLGEKKTNTVYPICFPSWFHIITKMQAINFCSGVYIFSKADRDNGEKGRARKRRKQRVIDGARRWVIKKRATSHSKYKREMIKISDWWVMKAFVYWLNCSCYFHHFSTHTWLNSALLELISEEPFWCRHML